MKKIVFSFGSIVTGATLWAQDEAVENDAVQPVNEAWYGSPWLWIVGAAMFIILLVALTKRKRD